MPKLNFPEKFPNLCPVESLGCQCLTLEFFHRLGWVGRDMALIDEPAVATFEIINEDSLFFWTFNEKSLGSGPLATLEGQYATWLTKKYGALDKAFASWGNEKHARDNVAEQFLAREVRPPLAVSEHCGIGSVMPQETRLDQGLRRGGADRWKHGNPPRAPEYGRLRLRAAI